MLLVDVHNEIFLCRNQQFFSFIIYHEQSVDGRGVHIRHFTQLAVVYFFHTETDEEIPTEFSRSGSLGMLHGKINLNVGKHPCAFCRIHSFEFDESRSV